MQDNRQEKSPVKQRILLFLAENGISQYEFYKITGITRGILTQNNGMSEDNVAKFLAQYPQVNTEWLLTGAGEMTKNERQERLCRDIPVARRATRPGEGIPLIPFGAMAGSLTSEQTALGYECERYVVPVFRGADFLMPVKGVSMYPNYSPGDIVACQRIPMDSLFFQWNKVYVLDTCQGPLIKRIKPGDDKQHVLLVSDNPEYNPFAIPTSAIRAVALVIGVIRLE